MKTFFNVVLVFLGSISSALGADFSYTIYDPSADSADDYIVSTSNAEIRQEGTVIYWKQEVGAATLEASTPGVITYHFSFQQAIGDATLFIRTSTFHWSYSRGHTYIYASTDGRSWNKIVEATPPEFASANTQTYNGLLPDDFIGKKDIWLRVELNSYGDRAADGGILTNTAQHSRYDTNSNNLTFSLEVNYQSGSSGSSDNSATQTVESISGAPLVATTVSAETIQDSAPANNAVVTDNDDEVTLVDEFDNKVNIKPNTLVTQHPLQQVDDASAKKTTLLRGSVELTIPVSTNDYILDTPLGQIIVPGSSSRNSATTQFSTDYSQSGFNGAIQISVTSGSVKLVDRQGNSSTLTAGQEFNFSGQVNRTNWVLPIDGDFIHGGLENTLAWIAYPNASGYILEYTFPSPNFADENPGQPEFTHKSIYFSANEYSLWQDLVILPMFIPDLPGSIVEARLFPIDGNGSVLSGSVASDKGTFTFK